jgi:Flp pilus assembly protein TadG
MRLKSQNGSNIIEFALILPLLLILVFGIIDFSIALYDKAVITNAAREGARAGIVWGPTRATIADITAVVDRYCANHLITFDPTRPPPRTFVDGAGDPSGSELTVRVEYDYTFAVIGRLVPPLGNLIMFESVSIMRME